MHRHLIGALLLVSSNAFAQAPLAEPESRVTTPRVYFEPRVATGAPGRLQVTPEHQNGNYMELHMWRKESDFPQNGGNGIHVVVPDGGSVSRDDWSVGFSMRGVYGGGCVPAGGPFADPNSGCLQETGPDGTLVYVYKERERWTFQHKHIEISSTGTPVEIEIPGSLYSFGYVEHTPQKNLQCFTVFPCDSVGVPLNPLESITVGGTRLACPLKSGQGYVSTIFYQYSRYKSGQVPAGANEWEPAMVPEQNGRAATYGKPIVTRHWKLDTGKSAFELSIPFMLHTAVDSGSAAGTTATGGDEIPTLEGGRGRLAVSAFDCEWIPNLSFNIDVVYGPGTGGHGHFISNDRNPDRDRFGNIASSYGGATGAAASTLPGRWQSSEIVAGRYAGDFDVTATTTDPRVTNGAGSRTVTGTLSFGFRGLSILEVDEADLVPYVRLTGDRNGSLCGYVKEDPSCEDTPATDTTPAKTCPRIQVCDNHLGVSHYGTPELHAFIAGFATKYSELAAAAGAPVGALGINDMSLPHGGQFDIYGNWGPRSHGTHRFGVDVDVDSRATKADGTFFTVNQRRLLVAVQQLGGTKMPEGPIHFRMRASDIDDLLRPLTNN